MNRYVLLTTVSLFFGATTGALAQGTAFTYQGRLNDGSNPADGSYDLRFSLHDALSGGAQLGGAVTKSATGVTNGLFIVTLDFGNQFPSAGRWLEIGVRTNGGGAFETLAPRQALTATPYAITAGGVTGSIDGTLLTPGSVGDAKLSTNVALRSGGNTFSGTQTINGALNVNYNGISTAAAILRARAGDEFPFAAQSVSGANLLLVRTNGQANVSGAMSVGAGTGTPGRLLQVGGASGVEGMIRLHSDSASGTAARTWDIGVPKDDAITSGKFYSFVIDDLGLGTDPEFMVKWGSGRVGIGTTNPAAKLDVNGDIRSGNISGTGTLNVNSAGYSDVTSVIRAQSGDTMPFVLQDLAGNNLLRIFTNGQANIRGSIYAGAVAGAGAAYETFNLNGGYSDTTATVHAGPAHNAAFRVENSSGSAMFLIYSNGQVNVSGKFYALGDAEVWGEISTTAINLTSDRNAKEDFKPVNPREVLDKVARLPISEWQYKTTDKRASDGSRHIGPMAQDFREAFALGRDDKHITSVDADGVALAAIQGLNQKLDEKDARIQELEESVKELKELVQRLTQSAEASGR